MVAITGPSGAARARLLNNLSCLDPPSGGRYLLDAPNVGTLSKRALGKLRGAPSVRVPLVHFLPNASGAAETSSCR